MSTEDMRKMARRLGRQRVMVVKNKRGAWDVVVVLDGNHLTEQEAQNAVPSWRERVRALGDAL